MSGRPPAESPIEPAVVDAPPEVSAQLARGAPADEDGPAIEAKELDGEDLAEQAAPEGDGAGNEPAPLDPGSSPAVAKTAAAIIANVFGRTDVGQIREHNEDNFLIADLTTRVRGIGAEQKPIELGDGGVLLAVCDGMGGAAAGEVASKLATDIIYERMVAAAGHRNRDRLAVDIVKALEDAGARILAEASSNRACRGMGTTATVAAAVDDHLLLGQVGDSRAYILRRDRLVQVTRDQSLVTQLIEAGQLTEEEAENFEHSNIILQALGTADALQVDLTFVKLRRGDLLMMCSDGLSGMVRDPEIREELKKAGSQVDACGALIEDANRAGGHDNITVIAARFEGDGLPEADPDSTAALKYQKYNLPAGIDALPTETSRVPALNLDAYDDTPSIEIHGEFEIDPDIDWDEWIDERAIPREPGPATSRLVVWALVVAAALLAWYLARG